MTMTTTQAIITIAAVVLGTRRTLYTVYYLSGKNPPEFVKYLGTVLPYAAIGLLVIYCLKDVPASITHLRAAGSNCNFIYRIDP